MSDLFSRPPDCSNMPYTTAEILVLVLRLSALLFIQMTRVFEARLLMLDIKGPAGQERHGANLTYPIMCHNRSVQRAVHFPLVHILCQAVLCLIPKWFGSFACRAHLSPKSASKII